MTGKAASVEAQALEWTILVQHPDFADWDELSAWLSADPRHADAFNRLTLLDDEIAAAVREIPPEPLPRRRTAIRVRQPVLYWGLLAASLVLVVVSAGLWLSRARPAGEAPPRPILIETAAGERRDVRLADGTRVVVAGATRLSIDPSARRAQLDEGQATFSVAHDPTRRFVVQFGDATVTDIGTVFDLRRRAGRSVVAVAQGEVRVEGAGAPVELTAGRRLRFAGASTRELDAIPPGEVAGWQQGRFSYADGTVAEVVADLEQATGAQVRLSPEVAGRRFAGTIVVNGDADHALHDVAPVLGLSASRVGGVWVLEAAHDAQRR